ncbi:MAG: hemin uptake protein HemP [Pseudomonadota bacterium]
MRLTPAEIERPREINSEELLGSGKVLSIRHGASVYTLRRTRAGKLILTK